MDRHGHLHRRRAGRGFTIAELVVTMTVIGVLSLIAVPVYNTVTGNSVKRTLVSTAESIARSADAAARTGDGEVDTTDLHIEAAVAETDLPGVGPEPGM